MKEGVQVKAEACRGNFCWPLPRIRSAVRRTAQSQGRWAQATQRAVSAPSVQPSTLVPGGSLTCRPFRGHLIVLAVGETENSRSEQGWEKTSLYPSRAAAQEVLVPFSQHRLGHVELPSGFTALLDNGTHKPIALPSLLVRLATFAAIPQP